MNKQTIPDQILVVVSKVDRCATMYGTKFLPVTKTNGPRFKYWGTNSRLEALTTPVVKSWQSESTYLLDELQETLGENYEVLHHCETMVSCFSTHDPEKKFV